MSVIAFYTNCKDQTGNTMSAISLATYLGITQNKKVLFISTSFNDSTIRKAFWESSNTKKSGLFGPNTSVTSENGVEGLDRVIRSNKVSPDIITDYTKAALKNRLEFLLGYKGVFGQYKELQKNYVEIVNIASKYYDTVILDIDKALDEETRNELAKISDVVVAMSTQKLENITELAKIIQEGKILKKSNTIITIGKYDDKSKYNIKNISRNLLRQRNMVNVIPYNTVLFEAVQEGEIIDMFVKFLSLKNKDENTYFIDEIKRLSDTINNKIYEIQHMTY